MMAATDGPILGPQLSVDCPRKAGDVRHRDGQFTAHDTRAATGTPGPQGDTTAGWIPPLRRFGAPHLRGSRPQSPVAAAGAGSPPPALIAVAEAATTRMVRSGGPPRLVRTPEDAG